MSISEKDIRGIAHLARIAVPDGEVGPLQAELGKVLELVDCMNAADTEGIVPMAHPDEASLRLRDDTVTEFDRRDALQASAPDVEQGYFRVPRVIE